MQGAIMRLQIDFKVHNNACIGLKSVTGIKALRKVFKGEEIYGAYRADPHTILTEYSQWSDVPNGFFARGNYEGIIYFTDVQKIIHLQLNMKMNVAKKW